MHDSVNHTRFPKEDQLPDWARRDNKVTKSDRVELMTEILTWTWVGVPKPSDHLLLVHTVYIVNVNTRNNGLPDVPKCETNSLCSYFSVCVSESQIRWSLSG